MRNIDTWNILSLTVPVWSPLLSGLLAAFIVHLLTQSRERERWVSDCKKQEFKELVSALTESYIWCLRAVPPVGADILRSRDEANANALRAIRDRIYITSELPLKEFAIRWSHASTLYMQPDRVSKEYEEIRTAIVDAASKCIPETSMHVLKFWKRRRLLR